MFRITFSCILLVLFLVSLVEAQKELKSAVERRQEREVYNKKIDDPANNPFNTDGATDRTTPGQIPKGKLLKLQPPPRMVLDTEISEVLDGDTVAIRNAKNQRVVIRLLGIDAPEIDQEFGRQARENLAEKLNGKKVRLAFEPRGLPDEQGRVLAKIMVDDIDICVDQVRLVSKPFRKVREARKRALMRAGNKRVSHSFFGSRQGTC